MQWQVTIVVGFNHVFVFSVILKLQWSTAGMPARRIWNLLPHVFLVISLFWQKGTVLSIPLMCVIAELNVILYLIQISVQIIGKIKRIREAKISLGRWEASRKTIREVGGAPPVSSP